MNNLNLFFLSSLKKIIWIKFRLNRMNVAVRYRLQRYQAAMFSIRIIMFLEINVHNHYPMADNSVDVQSGLRVSLNFSTKQTKSGRKLNWNSKIKFWKKTRLHGLNQMIDINRNIGLSHYQPKFTNITLNLVQPMRLLLLFLGWNIIIIQPL